MGDDGDSLKKFTIMLPRKIHEALREEAYLRRMPMAQIIIEALTHRIMIVTHGPKENDK